LPHNATNGSLRQFVPRPSRHRHRSGLGWMPELTVASNLARLPPPVFLQLPDDLPHLHEANLLWGISARSRSVRRSRSEQMTFEIRLRSGGRGRRPCLMRFGSPTVPSFLCLEHLSPEFIVVQSPPTTKPRYPRSVHVRGDLTQLVVAVTNEFHRVTVDQTEPVSADFGPAKRGYPPVAEPSIWNSPPVTI
jgi:hypothetical protein